jgi:Flp pilus assembly protein TadG
MPPSSSAVSESARRDDVGFSDAEGDLRRSAMTMNRKHRKGERGQVLILCAVCLVVLMLFVGLAIDFGFAYVTKAQLGKALDAAALTAARYSAQGPTQSTLLAQSAFAMNYGTPGRDHNNAPPVPTVVWSTDSSGNSVATVSATSTINTFFIGMLPQFKTLNVASIAQAKAARVELTLVLDRTGSMNGDGGAAALPSSVGDFITYFDNKNDMVALVSFANNVTVDVPMMDGGFQTPVVNVANAMQFIGSTYSDGGLQQALLTETTYVPPVGSNPSKVVLFFTDGNSNTIEDIPTCSGGSTPSGPTITWNFGGWDDGKTVVFLSTSDKADFSKTPFYPLNSNPVVKGKAVNQCQETNSDSCCIKGTFNSHVAGKPQPINWTTVSGPNGDARYRTIQDANAMRAAGITVYAIGLGTALEPVDPVFICEVANDPGSYCAGLGFVTNTSMPAGLSEFVTSGSDLNAAFQTIASIIRLRMTE